jgi:hypothetical protein
MSTDMRLLASDRIDGKQRFQKRQQPSPQPVVQQSRRDVGRVRPLQRRRDRRDTTDRRQGGIGRVVQHQQVVHRHQASQAVPHQVHGLSRGVRGRAPRVGPAGRGPGRGPAPRSLPVRTPAGSRRHRPRGRRTAPTSPRHTPATPGRRRPCRSGWSAPAGRSVGSVTEGCPAPAPAGRPTDPAGRSARRSPPGWRRDGATRQQGRRDLCSARRCAHRHAAGRPCHGHHREPGPAVRRPRPTSPDGRAPAAPAARTTCGHRRRAGPSARPCQPPNRQRPPARPPSDGRAERPRRAGPPPGGRGRSWWPAPRSPAPRHP